ncbi:MAG: RcnB family protein [Rhizomicrobium sp.]
MNRFFAAAAAACLLTASPALAEHHHNGSGGGQQHTSHTVTVHRGGWNNGHGHVQRTVKTTHVNVIRGGHERSRTVRRVTTTRTAHGRSVTTHRTAVNVRAYRRNFRAPRRYHWGTYRRPQGWYAHRWVYGERLPRVWFGRDYWIGDYVSFGLIAPPDGYEWVRVGDDALLVDVDTGEVLQVEYGVFY